MSREALGASFACNNTRDRQSWAEHFLSCHAHADQSVTFLEVRLNKPWGSLSHLKLVRMESRSEDVFFYGKLIYNTDIGARMR